MFQKNKKVIPHQYKSILKTIHNVPASGSLNTVFHVIFFAFCVVEEFYLVVIGDKAILGLIVNYVINMLIVCYD